MSSADRGILIEVLCERARQDERFGVQSLPDGTGGEIHKLLAKAAREACDATTASGNVTFAEILKEEFYEALAEEDPEKLREELIQVAAVSINWIGAIDRRIGPPIKDPLLSDADDTDGE